MAKKSGITKDKPCYMLDKDTNKILMEFQSYAEAGRYLKNSEASSHIGAVCRGVRGSAYGYKWKNKE